MALHRGMFLFLGAGFGIGAWLGCGDLFHSTDFLTLCDLDAKACEDAGPTDFCAWNGTTAFENAKHACAWLSACESPLGENAFGLCMANAILAFDCQANPDRKIRGRARAYWDCLWQAKSCNDIDSCVFPGRVQPCTANSGPFSLCGNTFDSGDNASTRVDCEATSGHVPGENCLATGRTCAKFGVSHGFCTGSDGLHCASSRCDSANVLHDCEDGGVFGSIDLGVDCTNFGAQRCAVANGNPACMADGLPCDAGNAIACTGDIAEGCPSGNTERVNCAALTGVGTCDSDAGGRSWDVTRACHGDSTVCSLDACDTAGKLIGCIRGSTRNALMVDCTALGLRACTTMTTFDGPRATCGAP